MIKGKVVVVIINYNGWNDTVECLKSFQNVDYKDWHIVIVDNNSNNDSVEKILGYLERNELGYCTVMHNHDRDLGKVTSKQYILVKSDENGGFSYGNNIGVNVAINHLDAEYIWLLNNDTVIDKDSIRNQVDYMNNNLNIGEAGARIYYYYHPNIIQAMGGFWYNKWIGTSGCVGNKIEKKITDRCIVNVSKFYGIYGASMFFRRECIEQIYPFDESYFYYFEEQDISESLKMTKYSLGYVDNAVVYHKDGSSIKEKKNIERDRFRDKQWEKNKLSFTYKYYPYALVTICIGMLVKSLIQFVKKRPDRAKTIMNVGYHFFVDLLKK